jgi:hypothetical protein
MNDKELLEKAREKAGRTWADLVREVGSTESYFWQIRNDKQKMGTNLRNRLEKYLDSYHPSHINNTMGIPNHKIKWIVK